MAKVKGSFFKACESGDLTTIGSVLEENPDAHKVFSSGLQAIHHAAWYNQKAAIELLLCKGADINGQTETGKTALSIAVHNGCFERCIRSSSRAPTSICRFPR